MCEGETPNSKFEIGKEIIKSINENKIIIKPAKILIDKKEYSNDILNLFTKFNSKIINGKILIKNLTAIIINAIEIAILRNKIISFLVNLFTINHLPKSYYIIKR